MGITFKVDKSKINFDRIATSGSNAQNGNFVKVNQNYWGDNGELKYKQLDNGMYAIYEGDSIMGFTDTIDGITELNEELPVEQPVEETPVTNVTPEPKVTSPEVAPESPANTEAAPETSTSSQSSDNGIHGFETDAQQFSIDSVNSPTDSKYSSDPSIYKNGANNRAERLAQMAGYALEMGFTDDQITIALGISLWETGNFKYIGLNNFGGVTGSGDAGSWYSERDHLNYARYSSEEAGMKAYLNNLKVNYFDQGLNTMDQIGRKYCGHDATEYNKSVNERIRNGIWPK